MKKPCASCGKQIPEAAQHCVFCNARQPDTAPVSSLGEALTRAAEGPGVAVVTAAAPHASKAGVTMMGVRVEDVHAAMHAHAAEVAQQAGMPAAAVSLDLTPVRGLPVVVRQRDVPRAVAGSAQATPFSLLVRLVMASGGLVLIALFSLPWRGVSSWQLLETLTGAEYVRQLYFLAGGVVLFAAAVLPVPLAFRALVGACVAALPLVLGAEGLLDGWRGLLAALAVIALPATHLARAPRGAQLDGLARGLVVVAVSIVLVLYLVPISSVVPLVWVASLLGSMSVGHTMLGLFIVIPLVLAALSLLGALGRDLASVAVLLSVLILLWAPAAMLIFIDDGTQLYVALALLWTSATAALCVTQLLALVAGSPPARALTPGRV